MEEVLGVLADQHAELAVLLDGFDVAEWSCDSPCAGRTVADVVVHLAQTDELAIGSLQGRFDDALVELAGDVGFAESIDAGAALMVERYVLHPTASIHKRWARGAATVRELLATSDPHERVTGGVGRVPASAPPATARWSCIDAAQHRGRWGRRRSLRRTASVFPHRPARLADGAVRLRPGWAVEAPGPVAFELLGPRGEAWSFVPDGGAPTVIRGEAAELCLVAARRVDPSDTSLRGQGPDADAVLELVRTYV